MGNSKEYWNPVEIIPPKKKVSFPSNADASTSIDYEKTNEQFGTKRYGIRNQNEHSRIFWLSNKAALKSSSIKYSQNRIYQQKIFKEIF